MPFTVAIAGKGGVGKTTVAGLIVTRLIARGCSPVLAVDADPNTCLDEVLGVKAEKCIGGVREEARAIAGKGLAAGVSKQELLEMKIAESLVEADSFDLIAMGRPEGPGCYCYANNVLKAALQEIAASYPYVVIDNEAGLENLSRRLVQQVDLLLLAGDPSKRGLDTIRRLTDLAREMDVKYERLGVVVNRLRNGGLSAEAKALGQAIGADYVFGLPDDDALAEVAEQGGSLLEVPTDNPVVRGIDEMLATAGPTAVQGLEVDPLRTIRE
jgi:CO dehydrogenase maturation factor